METEIIGIIIDQLNVNFPLLITWNWLKIDVPSALAPNNVVLLFLLKEYWDMVVKFSAANYS